MSLSSFEDQIVLPVLEEIINGEVKSKEDKRVAKEYSKTKSGSKVSKGKLKKYLTSPEGRLTITNPVMDIVRRLRIVGDTPRVNNRQKEQQINAVKKELSDDPQIPSSKKESQPIIKELMRVFVKTKTPSREEEAKKPRGRPPKERGESGEEAKRRIGRPRVEERGEAKVQQVVGRPAALAPAEEEPLAEAEPVEEVMTIQQAQEAEALRRSRAEALEGGRAEAPEIKAIVPVAQEPPPMVAIIGRNFSRDEVKDAREILQRDSKLSSVILSAVSRLLSGNLSVERIFEAKSLTRNRIRNIAGGLILVAQGITNPQLKRRSVDLSRALGAAMIARSSIPRFSRASEDFDDDGNIRRSAIDRVRKGFKPAVAKQLGEEPRETKVREVKYPSETTTLAEELDTLEAVKQIARTQNVEQIWIDFFNEAKRQAQLNPNIENIQVPAQDGGNVEIGYRELMNQLNALMRGDLGAVAIISGLIAALPNLDRVAPPPIAPPPQPPSGEPTEPPTQEPTQPPPPIPVTEEPTEPPVPITPPIFTPKKIQVQDQEENEKPPKTARVDYIIPTTKVLDPYADVNDRKADYELEVAFGYDLPFAMNGQILEQNPLMQQHLMEQEIRYRYGGISYGNNDWNRPDEVGFEKQANPDSVPALDFTEEYQEMPVNPNNTLKQNVEYNSMTEILSKDGNDKSVKESNLYGLQPTL
jgi:hypothetical protein